MAVLLDGQKQARAQICVKRSVSPALIVLTHSNDLLIN